MSIKGIILIAILAILGSTNADAALKVQAHNGYTFLVGANIAAITQTGKEPSVCYFESKDAGLDQEYGNYQHVMFKCSDTKKLAMTYYKDLTSVTLAIISMEPKQHVVWAKDYGLESDRVSFIEE